jgi:hypothetical protein
MTRDITSVLVKNIEFNEEGSKRECKNIDLILSGGAFNIGYLVGCLYFLREMREKGLIKINKISTCSASSLAGLLFMIDKVDMLEDKIYKMLTDSFKKNKFVIFSEETLDNVIRIVVDELPEDVLSIINHKLYITYYDVIECRKIVKSEYKTVDELVNVIKRSCFIPYITMDKLCEEGRYVDGGTPYIFNKEDDVKRLYINLCGLDKILDCMVIKKEKVISHRVLNGILDIHDFFFRGRKTSMCCYVDDWNVIRKIEFMMLELRIYVLCVMIYIVVKMKGWILDKYYKDNELVMKVMNQLRKEVGNCVEYYCV